MTLPNRMPLSFIPSPPVSGFHIGPLFVHFYGLMYVVGITLAVIITQRRVRSSGGDPSIVADVALWAVPAGIIGARIYFDLTTPADIPHVWYGVFAVWTGGLGVWLGHHTRIRPPGLFALYVTGYSAFRIYEETLRIDSSEHFLGLRLNLYVAS